MKSEQQAAAVNKNSRVCDKIQYTNIQIGNYLGSLSPRLPKVLQGIVSRIFTEAVVVIDITDVVSAQTWSLILQFSPGCKSVYSITCHTDK